jgi:hypothetical protein
LRRSRRFDWGRRAEEKRHREAKPDRQGEGWPKRAVDEPMRPHHERLLDFSQRPSTIGQSNVAAGKNRIRAPIVTVTGCGNARVTPKVTKRSAVTRPAPT